MLDTLRRHGHGQVKKHSHSWNIFRAKQKRQGFVKEAIRWKRLNLKPIRRDEAFESLAYSITFGDFKSAFNTLSLVPGAIHGRFCRLALSHLHLLAFSKSDRFPVELLKALIAVGCDVSSKDAHGRTLLHLLVVYERWDDLENSIDCLKKAIDETNSEGRTPLHEAALRSSVRGVDVLLRNGADVNFKSKKSNLTALHCAVLQNNKDVVERIFEEKNLEVNAKCVGGLTALDLAKENDSNECQELLMSKGAVTYLEEEKEDEENVWDRSKLKLK